MGDDITIGVTEIVNNIEVTAQPNDQIVDISVIDNADDVTLNITPTVIEINVNRGSSFAKWGTILGTLSDQTDLQNALLLKADLVDGKVPAYQLPSFVDDIIEVANYAALPATGEIGKIYVTLDNNKIYRWSGSVYIEIAANNAIWGAITGTLSSQTDLVNALNLRVPYTGATSNVNLGEYGLTSGFLGLDTTPTSTPTGIGTIYWDAANRTAALIDGDGDTTLQIGQEQRILVHNNTGSTLTDGQVVYVTGSTGNLPSVSLANASSETTSAATLGVVTESIAHGADGFITTSGIVNGLNTLAFNEGDLLWLGTTAGTFTATKPISPNHLVLIGYVIKKAGGNGSILVKIQNTQELEESSDVLFTSLANNQVLTYESATDLWKNKSIATILGYTPANDASVVKLTGDQSITGNKTFTTEVRTVFQNGDAAQITFKNTSDLTKTLNIGHGSNGNIFSSTGLDFRVGGLTSSALLILANENATFRENLTAKSFIKSGGTSSQFLKADGSIDSSTYSLDNAVVHLTGNETISGVKTLQNTLNLTAGVNIDDAYGFYWKTNVGEIETALAGIGQSSSGLNFFTGSSFISPRMFINSSGNVGIGTTSPAEKLSVSGAIISTGAITGHGANRTSLSQEGLNGAYWQSYGADASTVGTFSLRQATSDFSINRIALHINSSGNLGIGTTSPDQKLTVEGNIRAGGVGNGFLLDTLGVNYTNGMKVVNNYETVMFSGRGSSGYVIAGDNNLRFGFGTNYSAGESMRITSGGNVGIGTTSPSAKLHVDSDNTATDNVGNVFISTNNSQAANVGGQLTLGGFYNGGSKYAFGGIAARKENATSGNVAGYLALMSTTSAGALTERMRITSGGRVGIGFTSPVAKLSVRGEDNTSSNFAFEAANGSGNSLFYVRNDGATFVVGTITSSGGFFNSDIRLKGLTDYDYNVSDIKPITYLWKDGRDNKKHVGYSAQEVQKVMPDAVNEGTDGMLSVNYVEVLVAKIAELENRIKQLEK